MGLRGSGLVAGRELHVGHGNLPGRRGVHHRRCLGRAYARVRGRRDAVQHRLRLHLRLRKVAGGDWIHAHAVRAGRPQARGCLCHGNRLRDCRLRSSCCCCLCSGCLRSCLLPLLLLCLRLNQQHVRGRNEEVERARERRTRWSAIRVLRSSASIRRAMVKSSHLRLNCTTSSWKVR